MTGNRQRRRCTHQSLGCGGEGLPDSPVAGSEIKLDIPELLELIFVMLPVKLLLTLRCVSKTWRSVIDNPHFIYLHFFNLRNTNSHNNLVVTWETCFSGSELPGYKVLLRRIHDFSVYQEILTIDPARFSFDYLGYAYGLMLLSVCNHLTLYNPSIRKFLVLPKSPPCDLDASSKNWHLGFDPCSNDHKVLEFRVLRDGSAIWVASYTLSTGCWEAKTHPISNVEAGWILFSDLSKPGIRGPENFRVLSIDIARDKISCTEPLPGDSSGGAYEVIQLFLLGDTVAAFTVSYRRVCIWVLNKSGGNSADLWSKWHDGPLDSDTYKMFRRFSRYYVIGYDNFEICYAEEIEKLLLIMEHQVISFDLKTHRMEELETPLSGDYAFIIGGTYRESLLLSEGVGLDSLDSLL